MPIRLVHPAAPPHCHVIFPSTNSQSTCYAVTKQVLGIAANVIAVVEISVKILQVCPQYSQDVTNAKADIAELQQEVETLYDTTKKVKTLIEGPQGAKLKASQDFALKIT